VAAAGALLPDIRAVSGLMPIPEIIRKKSVAIERPLTELVKSLISETDEAAAALKAEAIIVRYLLADKSERSCFIESLLAYGPDIDAMKKVASAFVADPSEQNLAAIQAISDSMRQLIIRRLNQAPQGTAALVRMRSDVLEMLKSKPELSVVDADFARTFTAWFNKGFLQLSRIDWTNPATVLEKLIKYEAVHEIHGFEDLRRRLSPPDRRCFAYFHPNMPDEPLIFVEVALTTSVPKTIDDILAEGRQPIQASDAKIAVFYSISNCQDGLKGISFGNLLIKQCVRELQKELPGVSYFCTLSPVPGFGKWLSNELAVGPSLASRILTEAEHVLLSPLTAPLADGDVLQMSVHLSKAAAKYLLLAKSSDGRPRDPVARFHLGNGARLEYINASADLSKKGLAESYGVMVNYLYIAKELEGNIDLYHREGAVSCSHHVRFMTDS
jgi:malonyl-CoA decarboxylase